MMTWTDFVRVGTLAGSLLGAASLAVPGRAGEIDPARLPPVAKKAIDFRQDIYPLLTAHCFKCHQGADAKAGYRLDLRAEILGETNGKPLVRLGDSG